MRTREPNAWLMLCLADALLVTKFGDEGAQSLATSFAVNRSLTEIWLDGNKIGDEGARKLADDLGCNHSIKELGLGSNPISSRMKGKIKAVLGDPKRKAPDEPLSSLKQLALKGRMAR